MNYRNTAKIIEACDTVERRCTEVAGKHHGSAWLFDKAMRAFDFKPTEAVTYEVFINAPVMKPGEITIHRDGRLEMRTKQEL